MGIGALVRLGLVIATIALAACRPPVPLERDLLLTTATPGGTYYPVGVAMATLFTRELVGEPEVLVSAITSSGSAENIRMLETGEAQLAIVQALFGSMAWQGTGMYDGNAVRNLRSLCMLWENVEHVIALRRYAPSGDLRDLEGWTGRSFSLGPRWSGTEVSARTILTTLGIDPDTVFRVAHLGYGPSADALQNRRISGMFLAGGVPTAAVSQAFAGMGADEIALLEISDADLERLRAEYPIWRRYVIPEETYTGQAEPVRTLAQPNVLIGVAELDDDVVYRLLSALWENLEFLQRQHAAAKEMDRSRALAGLPVPLHPGAVRYYRDAGIDIPRELLPPELREGGER